CPQQNYMLEYERKIKMKNAVILFTFLAFLSATVWAAQDQKAAPPPGAKTGTTHPKPAAQMTTTPSGLQFQDLVVGKGAQPKVGDTVVVNYTGRFTSG